MGFFSVMGLFCFVLFLVFLGMISFVFVNYMPSHRTEAL